MYIRCFVAALVGLVAGCDTGQVGLLDHSKTDNDHGFAAMSSAFEKASAEPTSPASFRTLAQEIDAIRPDFHEEVEQLADLYLTFRALKVVAAQFGTDREQQLDALALTVFPTAFGFEPQAGDDVHGYLLRLCGEKMPNKCRRYVPEGWPLVLTAMARRSLKLQAGEALTECRICPDRAAYREQLKRFSDQVAIEDGRVAQRRSWYKPERWPMAGNHGAPWTPGLPLVRMIDGETFIAGELVSDGAWREPLAAARRDSDTLGVHLGPDADMRRLRALAADAEAAGYRELAIQAREVAYPYELRAYRIQLAGARAPRADVRDFDTMQLLVRYLDATQADGKRRL